MRALVTTLIFVVAVLGAGLFIGTNWMPGEWYAGLQKPFFTPPNEWFAPIWTTLYVIIGIVGARIWLRGGPVVLWLVQMALNFAWTPVFFGMHQMVAGLGIILALFFAIVAFIGRAWAGDKISSILFLPYAAWVATATALNASLILLN